MQRRQMQTTIQRFENDERIHKIMRIDAFLNSFIEIVENTKKNLMKHIVDYYVSKREYEIDEKKIIVSTVNTNTILQNINTLITCKTFKVQISKALRVEFR